MHTDTAVSQTVQTCVRFPAEQYRKIVTLARQQDRSISSVIRRSVRETLEVEIQEMNGE